MKYSVFISDCVNNIHDNLAKETDNNTTKRILHKVSSRYNPSIHAELVKGMNMTLLESNNPYIINHVKEGRYIENDTNYLNKIKEDNPILQFYINILQQDKYKIFNKGYFDAHIVEMIKRQVELNLFFIESYFAYLIICKLIKWESLNKQESIRFNNFITMAHTTSTDKPKECHSVDNALGINIEGFYSFKGFNGNETLGLYENGTLLYATQLKRLSSTEGLRMFALEDKIDDPEFDNTEFIDFMNKETNKESQIRRFLESLNLTKD